MNRRYIMRITVACATFAALTLGSDLFYSAPQSALALVETDYNLWMTAYSQDPCPVFSDYTRYHQDAIENVVKDTLPEEWVPSITTATGARTGAVLIRTSVWYFWVHADGGNQNPPWNFRTYNVDVTGGAQRPPGCSGRFNYWPGAGVKYSGWNNDRLRRAVDYTFGYYIPDGGTVRNISWGASQQNASNQCPEPNFSDCLMSVYGNDPSYRPAPIALQSGSDPKPYMGTIMGAWLGNNFGENPSQYLMGHAYNNGGTEWVHRWGPGWTQDFTGGTQGTGAIMQPDVFSGFSYWVSGAIWSTYLGHGGGGGWMGFPLGNVESVSSSACGYSVNGQKFQAGYVIWACPANSYLARNYSLSNVSVYLDINYNGGRTEYFLTDAADLRNNYIGNDAISSLRVPGGCNVTLYEHIQYGGQYTTTNSSVADLRVSPCSGCSADNTWNDATSSLRVSCSNP